MRPRGLAEWVAVGGLWWCEHNERVSLGLTVWRKGLRIKQVSRVVRAATTAVLVSWASRFTLSHGLAAFSSKFMKVRRSDEKPRYLRTANNLTKKGDATQQDEPKRQGCILGVYDSSQLHPCRSCLFL